MKGVKGFLIVFLVALIFSGVGSFLIYNAHKERVRTKNFITTIGVVVDYREDYDPVDDNDEGYYSSFDEDYLYAPIVEFVVDGKKYKVYSNEYSRNPPYLGDPINVSYNPKDPNDAIINKRTNNFVQSVGGGLFVAIGPVLIVAYLISNKKKR